MLEIDVYFGLNGGTTLGDVQVEPDPASLHAGDDVIWHFHAVDAPGKKVEYVQVEFKDHLQTFFGSNFSLNKKVGHGGGAKKGAHGHMIGTAPTNGGGTQKNTYCIRAFDKDPGTAGATKLYELDPTVVTCDP
jgi:hypothetical protein